MSDKTHRVFKTDEGDFDVSLFSSDGQHRYLLAQKLVTEISNLSNEVATKQAALYHFRYELAKECNDTTKIKYERARDEEGMFVADDPTTIENEAYVRAEN